MRFLKSRFLCSITVVVLIAFAFAPKACGNTPGSRSATLTWTASPTTGVKYNVYRGTVTGVCVGNVTPYAANVSGTSFVDTVLPASGSIFYAVSAVSPGGESACTPEASGTITPITTQPPVAGAPVLLIN